MYRAYLRRFLRVVEFDSLRRSGLAISDDTTSDDTALNEFSAADADNKARESPPNVIANINASIKNESLRKVILSALPHKNFGMSDIIAVKEEFTQ